MSMKKGFIGIIVLIVSVVALAAVWYTFGVKTLTGSVSVPLIMVKPPEEQHPIVGSDRDEHGCIGSAGYTWCPKKNKCLREWEESCSVDIQSPAPTADESSILLATMKTQIEAKHPGSSGLTFALKKIEGLYAQGSASETGGGGMWFASKTSGAWKLVWDGNGVILCSDLVAYPDFPKTMIPECWNDQTNKNVVR
jgi:hypothetical protein